MEYRGEQVPPGHGHEQAPAGHGHGHGPEPWRPPHPEPWRPPHPGEWRPPREQGDWHRGGGTAWLVGGVAVLGVLAVAATAAFVALPADGDRWTVMTDGSSPGVASAGEEPSARVALPEPSAPSQVVDPPTRGRPDSFPRVRPAADLPPEDARRLGTEVEVSTSVLRYRVMDFFDEPIYNCIFSVDLENLSDRPLAVSVGFRTTGAPQVEWADSEPTTIGPRNRSELIVGWDGPSPEEVPLTESECAGPVELTRLAVIPG